MLAIRESKLPFLFGAIVATVIAVVWTLGRTGIIQVEGADTFGFALFVFFFVLPLGVLMWTKVFRQTFAAQIDGDVIQLRSIDLFPRQVQIPLKSIYDVRLTEKNIGGEPITILKLSLSDDLEIGKLRSDFSSAAHFGFFGEGFDCSLQISPKRLSLLVDEVQQQVNTRANKTQHHKSDRAGELNVDF